jgi:hypothetical protein
MKKSFLFCVFVMVLAVGFVSMAEAADVDERPNQFWASDTEQTRAELVKLMGKPVRIDLDESQEGFHDSSAAQYQTYCYGSGDELNFYFIVGFESEADMKANKHNAEFLYCLSATSPRYPLEGISVGQTESQLKKSKGKPRNQEGEMLFYTTGDEASFAARVEKGKIIEVMLSRDW